MDEAQELARLLLAKTNIDSLTLKQGVVSSISGTGTLGIYLSAEQTFAVTGIHYLKSYKPKVGDSVWCMKNGPDLIVLGTLANGGNDELRPINLLAWGTPLAGALPPAGTQFYEIATSVVGTTSGVGTLGVTFPGGGFPNGLLLVTPTVADNGATSCISLMSSISKTAFFIAAFNGSAAAASLTLRFNYRAIGW